MKDFLSRAEDGLQNLIERTLERIAGGKLTPASLAVIVVRAVETSLRKDQGGRSWAPDKIDILLHPLDLEELSKGTPDLMVFLVNAILKAARDGGFFVAEQPKITLEVDGERERSKVYVHTSHSQEIPEPTRQMSSLPPAEAPTEPAGPRLIDLDGQVYPLEQEVVTIGRMKENDIVIADPHVSRRHAQIRLREERHVVFDLGSKAGTRVNGLPTMECELRHGDVITFAGNRLVYKESDIRPDSPLSRGEPGASI
jgi:hypothetical protein